MTLADKIVLKDGEIMQVGSPMDLFNFPDNEFSNSGSPKMNFFDGELTDASTPTLCGSGMQISGLRLVATDKSAVLRFAWVCGHNIWFWIPLSLKGTVTIVERLGTETVV